MMAEIAGLGVAGLVWLACVGAGAAMLRALGILDQLPRGERVAWSFALGIGVTGWITFFPAMLGLIAPAWLAALGVMLACGSAFLIRSNQCRTLPANIDPTGWILCAGIAVALAFDLLEGISPPADADSLAYHFALPKQFLADGKPIFVPRAADGAAPLLLHMTYLVALGLGGETGLTLWTMLSGWMAAWLVFILCRRFLDLNWSLAVALIFLTTPAVLYGAGAGQMETRLVLFAVGAAFAASRSMRDGGLRWVVLAGLLAGFFAGSKFMGLVFLASCGLPILFHRRWLARGAAFGVVALIAGGQWYGWNWVHSGDPLFPMLFTHLGLPDSDIWNARQAAFFEATYFGTEAPTPRTMVGLISYPFLATLRGAAIFESGRTGFGPYGLLILPFAVAALWNFRKRIAAHPLAIPVIIAFLFYIIWFISGSSQRVRHLLPIYPIALIGLTVAGQRWWAGRRAIGSAAAFAAALTIAIQLAGSGIFGASYLRHVVSDETREQFLLRSVRQYQPVPWINQNLDRKSHKVLLLSRHLVYLMEVPVFYAHVQMQAVIEMRPDSDNPILFLNQMKKQGITHLFITNVPVPAKPSTGPVDPTAGFVRLVDMLERARCTSEIKRFKMRIGASRTLSTLGTLQTRMRLLALTPTVCRL